MSQAVKASFGFLPAEFAPPAQQVERADDGGSKGCRTVRKGSAARHGHFRNARDGPQQEEGGNGVNTCFEQRQPADYTGARKSVEAEYGEDERNGDGQQIRNGRPVAEGQCFHDPVDAIDRQYGIEPRQAGEVSRRDQEIQYSACFQHVGSLYVSGDRFRLGFGIYDSGIARCALLPFVGIFWSLVSLPFAGVKYGMSSDRIFGAVRQSASGMPEGVVLSGCYLYLSFHSSRMHAAIFASAALRVFGS